MESKIYKISAYLVDVNGDYGEDYISWLLQSYSDLTAKHLKIESADIGEWDDDHPLNYRNSDILECEKYFKEQDNEMGT